LKRASPSKGMIRGSFPVGMLAMQLERAGAACLSVLTEEDYFHGSVANLREASAGTKIPCLRKDFIVDEFQLLEARANWADAVLLIVAALEQEQLSSLYGKARALGLDVLVEVHDEQELAQAVSLGCDMLGVNSRNLKTLEVNADTPLRLAEMLPKGVLRVAESGISTGADLRPLLAAGYQAFLVGESLMRADDAGAALGQLIATAKSPSLDATGMATSTAGTKD
jgi:indole-3-glycerol phosphate synthase